ncbi:uncharacterized protein LOC125234109 [Leguminivora glycinivorella]|uniref:uncharacterized protein LOC125234109 n=1 Tax=Leguminivora glycinivorella TaxID=1035111 RepID=UPI00200EC305|nr:uncharacterized protein LOC125234109 [Leguminivora glycinivorella]
MSLDVNISEPEEFNCQELHTSIEKAALIKGIKDFKYHVDTISGKGDNYIANLFRVIIKNTEDETNSVNVIVKTLINTARQETFSELHKREVKVYNKVLPMFNRIQEVINDDDRVIFPDCLLSSFEEEQEILILEDMQDKGYAMSDKVAKFESLSFEEIETILKELAKFHALSLIGQKKEPEEFKKLQSKFKDLMFDNRFLNKSNLRKYFVDSFEMSLKVVEDVELKKVLEQIGTRLIDLLRLYTSPKKFNVLCHGDCWVNNVLFKKTEDGDRLCFLDFQALRNANPATDVLHFLYLCTNSNFRSQHLENLLDAYYESFQTFSNLFNVDASLIYPKEDFYEDVRGSLPFGFLIAFIELRIVSCTAEDIDFLRGSNLSLNTLSTNDNELFKIRINDVVKEASNNGTIERLIDEMSRFSY